MTTDLFKQARERLTIPEAWEMLGLQAEPKTSCKSPFRNEHTASFTIYDNGTKWKDHGEQIGGDVVEFIKHAIGGDYQAVREWLQSRLGGVAAIPSTTPKSKRIDYPAPLTSGTEAQWLAFANHRSIGYATVSTLAKLDVLKFCTIQGNACFVLTDAFNKVAEIRRIDGGLFGTSKAYPLPGVDKSFLLGAALIEAPSQRASILICEGATDFLTAMHLYVRHRRETTAASHWIPTALLGAGCRTLSPQCAALLRGRHVRLVPDGDTAGDRMRGHWEALLLENECTVDCIEMPRGKDLTNIKNELEPSDIFTR